MEGEYPDTTPTDPRFISELLKHELRELCDTINGVLGDHPMTQGMSQERKDPIIDLQSLVSTMATDFAANQYRLSELEADNRELIETVNTVEENMRALHKREAEYVKQMSTPANNLSYQTSLLSSARFINSLLLASLPSPLPFLCETYLKMDEEIIGLRKYAQERESTDWQMRLKREGEIEAEKEEVERRIQDELTKLRDRDRSER